MNILNPICILCILFTHNGDMHLRYPEFLWSVMKKLKSRTFSSACLKFQYFGIVNPWGRHKGPSESDRLAPASAIASQAQTRQCSDLDTRRSRTHAGEGTGGGGGGGGE